MAMLQLSEIKPGIVIHLTHSVLAERGIRVPAQRDDRLGHPFLCLRATLRDSTWGMLTSSGRFHKYRIPSERKSGTHWWMKRDSYLCGRDAVIHAINWDIQVASEREQSTVGRRNSIDQNLIPVLAVQLGLNRCEQSNDSSLAMAEDDSFIPSDANLTEASSTMVTPRHCQRSSSFLVERLQIPTFLNISKLA